MPRSPVASTTFLDVGILLAVTKRAELYVYDTCTPTACEEVTNCSLSLAGTPTTADSCLSLTALVLGTDQARLAIVDIRETSRPTVVAVDGPVTCLKVLDQTIVVTATTRGVSTWDLRLLNRPLLRFKEVKEADLAVFDAQRPAGNHKGCFVEDLAAKSLTEKLFDRNYQVSAIFQIPEAPGTIACHQKFPGSVEIFSTTSGRLLERVRLPSNTTCIADNAPDGLPRSLCAGKRQALLIGNTDGAVNLFDPASQSFVHEPSHSAHVGGVAALKVLGNWGCLTVGSDGAVVVHRHVFPS